MSSLKEKSIKGIFWLLIENFGQHFIRFFFGIILARLLMPEDFGIIGIITVIFTLAMVFVESGFSSAYVQKKEADDLDANTIFYFNILVSTFAYFVLWISAPLIARFYEEPELIKLTRVMSLVVIINAFQLIQYANIARDVNFKLRTKASLPAILLGGVLGVTAAYLGFGVWSLVIQSLSRVFIKAIGLWLLSSWRPSLMFSYERLKIMFSFSAWILFSSLIKTFFDNIYILTIGKFFPTSQLGFYTKAKQIQGIPTGNIVNAIDGVSFPVLAKFQDDNVKMVSGIRKFLKYTMFITTSLTAILLIIAKPFVLLILTEKWEPMIPYLQLLCIAGLSYPIHAINVRSLLALGKSRLNFNITLIKNCFRVINIVVMFRFGITYIILGEIILSLVALNINTYYIKKILNYGFFDQLKDIYKIIFGGVLVIALGLYLAWLINNMWLLLILNILCGIIIFSVSQYLFNRELLKEILKIRYYIYKK